MAAVAANFVLDYSAVDHASAGGRASQRNRKRLTNKEKSANRRALEIRLAQELSEGKTAILESWSPLTELFVVSSEDLNTLFTDWYTRRGMNLNEAAMYVASEIGCHKDVLTKLNKRQWTPLSLAEAVLIVLGREYATHNDEIPVYVSPRFTFKQWCQRADAECAALEWLLHTHPDQWCRS